MNIKLCILLFFSFASSTFAQIRINEVCSDNESIISDEENDYEDWIELYNTTSTPVNLENYFLSDNLNDPEKWIFPNIEIPANGFLLVFASGKDFIGTEVHTNFKISKDGESIILSNANSEIIDQINIPALDEDISYGRQPDGSETLIYFSETSPLSSNNNTSTFNFANKPTFQNTNFFSATSNLITLECNQANCEIFYTTDGSLPDENSFLYTGPIQLDTTTTLRIASRTPDLLLSKATTRTFFINDTHSLPIVSLSTTPSNLWDFEEGIMVKGPDADSIWPFYGANFWKEIEIPAHFEYFENEELKIEYPLGTEIHGGRGSRTKNMKALRLLAKSEFGTDLIDYPFYTNKPVTEFKRLVLRNASGDFNVCHTRDEFLARYFIDNELDFEGIDQQPIIVYLNGEYYGVMHLREKLDRFYLQYNYGVDPNNLDLLEEDTIAVEGDFTLFRQHEDFVLNNDLSDSENFEVAASYFDLSNISDYFIAQTFVNNTDWPNNNIKYWREKKPDAKWRYFLFDMDVAMGFQGYTTARENSFGTRMEMQTNHHVNIIRAFFDNENFRHYFVNRYADLMNTIFHEESLGAEVIRSRDELAPEMERHFDKWGKTFDNWYNNEIPKLSKFANERPAFARQFLQEYFELPTQDQIRLNTFPENSGDIKVNTITIKEDLFPWDGIYFNSVPIELTVLPKSGFTFAHWESNLSSEILSTSPNLVIHPRDGETFTAIFVHEHLEPAIQLMPNPSSNLVNIQLDAPNLGPVDIRIFDATGRQVLLPINAIATTGENNFTIDIQSIPDGVYYVHITGKDFSIAEQLLKFSR